MRMPWKIELVSDFLCQTLYRAKYRGKTNSRFALTRPQIKRLLQVERMHEDVIRDLQDAMLRRGFVLVDFDDLFACLEASIVRGYRQVPADLFENLVKEHLESVRDDEDEEEPDELADEQDEIAPRQRRGRKPMSDD